MVQKEVLIDARFYFFALVVPNMGRTRTGFRIIHPSDDLGVGNAGDAEKRERAHLKLKSGIRVRYREGEFALRCAERQLLDVLGVAATDIEVPINASGAA